MLRSSSMSLCLLLLVIAGFVGKCDAFVANLRFSSSVVSRTHASTSNLDSSSSSTGVQTRVLEGDDVSMEEAAAFMVDAFWLNSPQQLVQNTNKDTTVILDGKKSFLVETQKTDLVEKYGERLGKRLFDACLVTAGEDSNMLGLVGIKMSLFDKSSEQLVADDQSESMVKNAVSSLGPKQRRLYKDSSLQVLVAELLPPEMQLVCCLSNLAVSPLARRQGVAQMLCEKAEEIACDDWGSDSMFLKVEAENEAANRLYQQKLGYKQECASKPETALRVDAEEGTFTEVQAETIILTKTLGRRSARI